jgi:hypothetical protein
MERDGWRSRLPAFASYRALLDREFQATQEER